MSLHNHKIHNNISPKFLIAVIQHSLILLFFAVTGLSSATDVFTLTPESLTVVEGTTVTFICSTPHKMIVLQWIGGPGNASVTFLMDKNGMTMSFIATKERNITCQAGGIINTINGSVPVFTNKIAYLLVQGDNYFLSYSNNYSHCAMYIVTLIN